MISTPCHTRMYVSAEQLDHFLDFVTSAHIVQDLPFGESTLKLSSKEKIIVPNVVRTVIPERIVQQYNLSCSEAGFLPMGRSTLLRMLIVCSASVRNSLQGLDYFTAQKPSMTWRMLLTSLEMTVGWDCHGPKKRGHS